MDARSRLTVLCAVLMVVFSARHSSAASYRTRNFVVQAPSTQLAREIGDMAERYRRDLAVQWLGEPMPQWGQACLLTAEVSPHLGAGGATSFVFDRGEVFGWRMNIQGSRERILDSVLPHEVMHTVFACRFRQPLPRWADEGACTTVEHASEQRKQQHMLITFLKTGRGIPFDRMFAMKEYPRDVLPLYSQGYSLARYLLAQGGREKFLNFVEEGMQQENWPHVVQKYYGHQDLYALQTSWLTWVKDGSPPIEPPADAVLVAAETPNQQAPGGQNTGGEIAVATPAAQTPAATAGHDSAADAQAVSQSAAGALVQVAPASKQRPRAYGNVAARTAHGEAAGWRPAGTTRLSGEGPSSDPPADDEPEPRKSAAAGTAGSYADRVASHLSNLESRQTSRPQPIEKLQPRVIEEHRSAGAYAAPPHSPATARRIPATLPPAPATLMDTSLNTGLMRR